MKETTIFQSDSNNDSPAPGLAMLHAVEAIPLGGELGDRWIHYYVPADLYSEQEDSLEQQVMKWIIIPGSMEDFQSGFYVNWEWLPSVTAETEIEPVDILTQVYWVTEAEELTDPESALLPIMDSPAQALQSELRFQKALRQHKADRRTGGDLLRVPKSATQQRVEHWLYQLTGIREEE